MVPEYTIKIAFNKIKDFSDYTKDNPYANESKEDQTNPNPHSGRSANHRVTRARQIMVKQSNKKANLPLLQ